MLSVRGASGVLHPCQELWLVQEKKLAPGPEITPSGGDKSHR